MNGLRVNEIFEKYLPKRRIGCLSPLSVIDFETYQLNRLLPQDVMLVMVPIGLQEFTPNDVERVFSSLEENLSLLTERGVDIVVQVGVPLPILMGLAYHDALLSRMKKITGKPAISQVLNIVASAKFLGIRNIALANKWNDQMNNTLGRFFGREGIRIAGVNARSMGPSEFLKLKTEDSLSLAYELGRGALVNYPEADGLYIGGGAWITFPIVEVLEKEFGKPVITNETAMVWHVCHLLDYWKPVRGYGRLLQSQ